MVGEVFYECDKRACLNCNDECDHTSDISHAVNFESINGVYFEKKHPINLLVVKTTNKMTIKERQMLWEHIRAMKESGVIVLPDNCELLATDGTDVIMEEEHDSDR